MIPILLAALLCYEAAAQLARLSAFLHSIRHNFDGLVAKNLLLNHLAVASISS